MLFKIGVLKKFAVFTVLDSPFKMVALKACNFIEKRLQ